MESPQVKPIPKKSCIITLMFEIESDIQAITIKQSIDDAIKDIDNKKYNFQINET